jgi:hypothetical protein
MSRQPVEPIDKAQHIRHEYVGDGEGPGQPCASGQHRLQVLELARSTFQATADDLARKAGGVTAYMRAPAKGLWRKRGARLERDYIVVYEVMVKSLRRREWRMRRKDLERTFRQDEMVIRVLATRCFPDTYPRIKYAQITRVYRAPAATILRSIAGSPVIAARSGPRRLSHVEWSLKYSTAKRFRPSLRCIR